MFKKYFLNVGDLDVLSVKKKIIGSEDQTASAWN